MTTTATIDNYAPNATGLDKLRNRLHLDATTLKIFACVLMVIDHIHQMFVHVGAPTWLTMLGRLVFPIFLFLMADSFHYTRNRKTFLTRLLIAGWAMTIGSTIIAAMFPNDQVILINNAFTTFFVAGLYMLFYDRVRDGVHYHSPKKVVTGILLFFVPIITAIPLFLIGALSADPNISPTLLRIFVFISLLIPNVIAVEGGFLFVLLALMFYIVRPNRWAQVGGLVAFSALVFAMGGGIQWMMVFAAIPMLLYNGQPGSGMKDFFYVFYPAHIWILYMISTLLSMYGIIHTLPQFIY